METKTQHIKLGAIVPAAISAGVRIDDAVDVLNKINERTKAKSNAILSSFTPGFSLVDQVEDLLISSMQVALGGSAGSADDYDNELLMNRIDNGRLLLIGLTDRRKFLQKSPNTTNNGNTAITPRDMLIKGNMNMYVYASKYRDLKDVASAAILSSYIPIGTGPLRSSAVDTGNTAVKHSFDRVKEMEKLGFLNCGITGEATIAVDCGSNHDLSSNEEPSSASSSEDCYFLDGGLVNMFPVIDKDTVMVTPLNCTSPNPFIAPEALTEDDPYYLDFDNQVSMGVNMQNMRLLTKMLRSSDPSYLDEKFREGYDNANKFLKDRDLLTVFS